jgi:hypothetical protein
MKTIIGSNASIARRSLSSRQNRRYGRALLITGMKNAKRRNLDLKRRSSFK